MQTFNKILLFIVVICYISTAFGKQKTVKDTVSEGVKKATDGVKVGAKVASDAAKNAG